MGNYAPQALNISLSSSATSIALRNRTIAKVLIYVALIAFAAAVPAVQAQTCENIPNPGSESLVGKIRINGTNTQLANGGAVPAWTYLKLDSVIEATGSCTGMSWTNTTPSTCAFNGTVWERVPNHTEISVEIDTGTEHLGFLVGYIFGTGVPPQHVINSESSDSTGSVIMAAGWKGTYTFHFNANINTTPCNLEPHLMQEQIIVIHVGDNDGDYDSNGNLTRRTDALNNQTNIAYDAPH